MRRRRQVLVAMRDLHRNGLVHGDVKPQNLVKVHADDLWKLIDFVTCSEAGSSVHASTAHPGRGEARQHQILDELVCGAHLLPRV